MKIVKCSKCGKYFHKASQCIYCGNTDGFEDVFEEEVHENVAQEYIQMESFVKDKKYSEAIHLSYTILEWMPSLAGVFWLRLLAKNKCTNAGDLIRKGFPCDTDPDFCNALIFSSGIEHTVYENIQTIVFKIRDSLLESIKDDEYKRKNETDIIHIWETMQGEIDRRKEKLFSLWGDLETIENSLFLLETECQLLTEEYQTSLNQTAQAARRIESAISPKKEGTEKSLYSIQVDLGNVLQLSESSRCSIETLKKQHPWVKEFNDLVSQRDLQLELINSEFEELQNYERSVEQWIAEVENIESCHKAALAAVRQCEFANSESLLGTDAVDRIFHNAGVAV